MRVPSVGGVGGMDQRHDLVRAPSAASTLAKPVTHDAGLAGDRQRIERRALEQPLGLRRKVGRDAHLALEAAGEDLARDRLVERRAASP